jgi:quinol monooxygenase YgiN
MERDEKVHDNRTSRRGLTEVVDRMRAEDSFIDAVISEDLDHPDVLVMYETWLGSRESWFHDEYPRSYRAHYEGVIGDLVESRSVEWLTPLTSWYSDPVRS